MILRFCAEVLEDRLLPVALHVVPVINHAMADRIVHAVAWCPRVCECLIADEEVEIFDPSLGCKVSGLGGNSRSAGSLGC